MWQESAVEEDDAGKGDQGQMVNDQVHWDIGDLSVKRKVT